MKKQLNLIKSVTKKFFKDSCLIRASGLAYSTLLAVVPFITVLYAFGGFDALGKTIENQILKAIIPAQHEAVSQALNAFTRNSLTTGTLGLIFFLLTSIFLINTVARNFDAIWGEYSKVNFFRRYATYTAVLVFGSLLLGVSNSFSSILENYILSVGIEDKLNLRGLFSSVLPFFITLIIFYIMLTAIPYAKVRFKSAITGALFSAVIFEIIKVTFKFWILNSVRTSIVYGSFSIIPIFLVSLYLFWLIVLIGVEISYFMQSDNQHLNSITSNVCMEDKLCLGIDIYLYIAKAFLEKRVGGVTEKEIETDLNLSRDIIDSSLQCFFNNQLILLINSKVSGIIPSRSLDRVYISDIVKSIYGKESKIYNASNISLNNSKAFTEGGFSLLDKDSILKLLSEGEYNEKQKD